jgi:pimeloyl-ACP methyl ester carboxylesterase
MIMTTAAIPIPQFRTFDGVRIRYTNSGGTGQPVILLTSPWPESLYAFAPMWSELAERARLFAIDLPGFGASERRDDLLSPRAMGDFLNRFIAEAELGTPHVVAPDVGTAAALFAAAAHPERMASVTVGTGGAAVPIQLGEPLASWVLDPDLDKYRRMDPRMIVNTAVETIAGGIPNDIRADYLSCYDGDRFVESMRYVRRYPEELPALARLLPRSRPPSRSSTAGTTVSCHWRTPSFSMSGCPIAASSSSTPGTSSGKRSRRSTPRPSSARSPPPVGVEKHERDPCTMPAAGDAVRSVSGQRRGNRPHSQCRERGRVPGVGQRQPDRAHR